MGCRAAGVRAAGAGGVGEHGPLVGMGFRGNVAHLDYYAVSFLFFLHIHDKYYIHKNLLQKIMGIQLNTLDTWWARPCVAG